MNVHDIYLQINGTDRPMVARTPSTQQIVGAMTAQ